MVWHCTEFVGAQTVTRSRDLELKFARVKVDMSAAKQDATVRLAAQCACVHCAHACTVVQIAEECPQCGRMEMTFKTAQLRSADEGQTIFYFCKCGYGNAERACLQHNLM